MSRIISFKGRLDSGDIENIPLHTQNGSIGYKITKFQIIGVSENQTSEGTCKIFKTQPTTATSSIDFSDNRLIGVATFGDSSATPGNASAIVLFDNEIFNQDIYLTWLDGFANKINYYIELEQMDLALDETTVATLKDIRNND